MTAAARLLHNSHMTTPILMSWSGGKDCLMALARLLDDPRWRVVGLLTTVTGKYNRIAMHGIRREVLQAQAAALGLPVWEATLDGPVDNATYEQVQAAALKRAQQRWPGLRHCAFGDIFLEDVRAYREHLLRRHRWHAVFPLWGEDTDVLARRFHAEGFRAHTVCVDTTQLDAAFSGRAYDATFVHELPAGADPCGEHGEFHTLSHAGPPFAHPLALRVGESVLRDDRFQYTDFLLDDDR